MARNWLDSYMVTFWHQSPQGKSCIHIVEAQDEKDALYFAKHEHHVMGHPPVIPEKTNARKV